MARSIWEDFLSFVRRNESDDSDRDDEHRFVPSPLDLSVRYSHGGAGVEAKREIDRINEAAAELEELQREE